MEGMLFSCKLALCYELSVLKPFLGWGISNKCGQLLAIVLASSADRYWWTLHVLGHWGSYFIHEND